MLDYNNLYHCCSSLLFHICVVSELCVYLAAGQHGYSLYKHSLG